VLAVVIAAESVAILLIAKSLSAWVPVLASAAWFAFAGVLAYSQLCLVKRPDGSRLDSFGLSNTLTLFRFLNIPLVVLLMPFFPSDRGLLLVGVSIFTAAVVSDTLDGNIARLTGTTTDFGRIYDPVCDIAINAGVCVGAWLAGYLPWWYLLVAELRFFLPLLGGAWLYVYRKPWKIRPTLWGKLSVFVYALFIAILLLRELTGVPFLVDLSHKFLWLSGLLFAFNLVHIVDRGLAMMVRPIAEE
jgi:phosphatidylglycerophosphate synthase